MIREVFLCVALMLCANAYASEPSASSLPPLKAGERYEADHNPGNERSNLQNTLVPRGGPAKTELRDYLSPEWDLVWVTLLLAVVTTGLAIFTAKLWAATKSLAADAKTAAQKQAEQTQESLKIAGISADAAKASADALPMTERAYVFPEIFINSINVSIYGPTKFSARITFRNHGRTPAIIGMLRAYLVVQKDVPAGLEAISGSERKIPPGLIIASNGGYDISVTQDIPQDAWSDANSGAQKLYCVGEIAYRDIWKQDRNTGFCWELYTEESKGKVFGITPESPLNDYE